MKNTVFLIILSLFFILVSCASNTVPQNETSQMEEFPGWYMKIEASPGILIGYGEGDNREIAAEKARNDLAAQIEVQIKSEIIMKESGSAESSTFFFEQNLSSLVDVVLIGARRLEEESVNGRYYTAWSYDNRPMRSRALEAAKQGGSGFDNGSLKKRLPFTRFLAANSSTVSFHLDYRLDNWFLLIGNETIPISRGEFCENFFPLLNPERLVVKRGLRNGLTVPGLKPDELKEGQFFFLEYHQAACETTGYLNLFYIDNRGLTLNLIENHHLNGELVIYPDPTLYDGLIAEVETGFNQSTDVILAVETPEPLDFAAFIRKVTSDRADIEDEGLHSYGLLLEQLDAAYCSSRIVRIIR